jgi:hypothetical protein
LYVSLSGISNFAINFPNPLVIGMMWKQGVILCPWASHAGTKTVDGTEREGNATLEIKVSSTFVPSRRALFVLLSRHRLILIFLRGQPAGGGSGVGSILPQLHPSSSPLNDIVAELVSDIYPSTSRSNDYSKNDGNVSDWKALLLNKVVVGRGQKLTNDNTSLTKPPPGSDSVSILGVVFLVITLIRD